MRKGTIQYQFLERGGMEELLNIAEGKDKFLPVKEVTEWIFQRNVALADATQDEIRDFLAIAFQHVVGPLAPRDRHIPDWDHLRLLMAISSISLFPLPKSIPDISPVTTSGAIFVLILILHHFRSDHIDFIKQYRTAFTQCLKSLENVSEARTFYSQTTAYWSQILPTILKKNLPQTEFTELLRPFFEIILRMKPETMNINSISFATDMFKHATHHLMQMRSGSAEYWAEFVRAYQAMLENGQRCPAIMLLNFLHPWTAITRTSMDVIKRLDTRPVTDIMTRYCGNVACEKHHELHRMFPWHIELAYYNSLQDVEQQTRVLALFCNAMRTVLKLETIGKEGEKVSDTVMDHYNRNRGQKNGLGGSWSIYYILSGCKSAAEMAMFDMKRIHGLRIDMERSVKKRRVTFAQQCYTKEGNKVTDEELSSVLIEKAYATQSEAENAFNEHVQLLENCKKKIATAMSFHTVLIGAALENMVSENKQAVAIGFDYILAFIRTYLKIIITVTHRTMMLDVFKFAKEKDATFELNLREIPDFSAIFQEFTAVIEKIPHQYYRSLSYEIADIIYKAKQKGVLTTNFVNTLSKMRGTNSMSDFFTHLLSELMQVGAGFLSDILAASVSKVRGVYEWMLLIVRIGSHRRNDSPDPSLVLVMKNYHKLIFNTIVTNIKKISVQSYAMKIIDLYMKIILNGADATEKQDILKPLQRMRATMFDELQPQARLNAISVFLEVNALEPGQNGLQALIAMAEVAFRTHNTDLIKRMSSILFTVLSQDKTINADSPIMWKLFKEWFGCIQHMDQNTAVKVISAIHSLTPAFVHPGMAYEGQGPKLMYTGLNINIAPIIDQISLHLSNTDEDAINLFTFVTWAFEAVKESRNATEIEIRQVETQLLLLLSYCSNFEFLKQKVSQFVGSLVKFYGDLYVETGMNRFILNVIGCAGAARSEKFYFPVNVAIQFFEYVSKQEVTEGVVTHTIEESLCYFNTADKLCSVITALSLFTRFFPRCVTTEHIRTFLLSANEIYVFDLEITVIIKRLLTDFVNSRSEDEKRDFVMAMYDLLTTTVISCRLIVLRVIAKLGIKLPVSSWEEIKNPEKVLEFQALVAVLSCGTETPLPVEESVIASMNDFMGTKNENVLEKLSRKMTLYMCIVRSTDTFTVLSQRPAFVNSLLNFLCNTLSSRFQYMRKNAGKLFRLLLSEYQDNEYTTRQITEYCNNPNKIFVFFSPQHERIAFYRRLTKIAPEQIPKDVVSDFMKAVFEYTEGNDAKKFKFLNNLVDFVKYLTIEKFVNIPEVREIILSPYDEDVTYLQYFIKCITELYKHKEIPFREILRKRICKFLVMFACETVEYICTFHPKLETVTAFTILTDLILDDRGNTFAGAFVNFMQSSMFDPANDNPGITWVLRAMANDGRFVEDAYFISTVDGLFERYCAMNSNEENATRGMCYHTAMMELGAIVVKTLKNAEDVTRIIRFARVFDFTGFRVSSLYQRFISTVFKKSSQSVIMTLLYESLHCEMSERVHGIIIGHCVKYLEDMDESVIEEIWNWLDSYTERVGTGTAVLITLTRLLAKYEQAKTVPHRERASMAIRALKLGISSPGTHIVVYSIKLACVLMNMKLMDDELYSQITEQLFSYTKFFDQPFSRYVHRFLNIKPEVFADATPSLARTIAFFPHDKFMSLREMKRFVDIFSSIPNIHKILPFSVITTLSWHLEARSSQKRATDNLAELEPLFHAGIDYCNAIKPSSKEVNRYMRTCFDFMRLVINQRAVTTEFPEVFVRYLLTLDDYDFNTEILSDINANTFTKSSFALICAATKFAGDVLLAEYPQCLENAIRYMGSCQDSICPVLLKQLGDYIMSREHAVIYQDGLVETLKMIMQCLSTKTLNTALVCLKAIIETELCIPRMRILTEIWTIIGTIVTRPKGKMLTTDVVRELTLAIEYIDDEEQGEYFRRYIASEETMKYGYNKVFLSTVPSLLHSNRVSIKTNLLQWIPVLCSEECPTVIDGVLDALETYQEAPNMMTVITMFSVVLMQFEVVSPSNKIRYIKRISELLPENKLEFLFSLPVVHWNNTHLVATVSLLACQDPFCQSMTIFGSKMENCSHILAEGILKQYLNADTSPAFHEFFNGLLIHKPRRNYTQIIQALLDAFYSEQQFLNPGIAQKAMRYCNRTELSEYFMSSDDVDRRLMLGCEEGDSVFAFFAEKTSMNEAAAAALTSLCEYRAADALYASISEYSSSFSEYAAQMNAHFLHNDDLGDLNLKCLSHMGLTNETGLNALMLSVESIEAEDQANAINRVRESAIHNLKVIKSKSRLSTFDKEQITAIDICIQMIRKRGTMQKPPDVHAHMFLETINPSFIETLAKLENKIYGNRTNLFPEISGDAAFMTVHPSMISNFRQVAGLTNRGMLYIGNRDSSQFMNDMSEKIASRKVNRSDWCNFAPFTFNIFLANPNHSNFSLTYSVYSQILSSTGEHDVIQKREATARLIVLARIAASEGDPVLIKVVQSAGLIFRKANIETWKIWLVELVRLAKDAWFREMTMDLFHEMWYRSSLYAKKLNCMDLLHTIQIQRVSHPFIMMKHLEEALDEIFTIDFRSVAMTEVARRPPGFNPHEYRDNDFIPVTPLQRATMSLTHDEITAADTHHHNDHARLGSTIDNLNRSLPFVFPLQIDNAQQITIYRFDRDWRMLAPDLLVFHVNTSTRPKQTFLIEKSPNPTGFKPSFVIYSNMVSIFRTIMQNTYVTRARSLFLPVSRSFEIGPCYVMVPLPGDLVTLENVFEQYTQMHADEYLIYRPALPTDALKRYVSMQLTAHEFHQARHMLMRSWASKSVVHALFGVPAAHMNHCLISLSDFTSPLIHSERELASSRVTLRMSPNMADFMGPSFRAHFLLLQAAAARSLVDNIELVRSYIEIDALDAAERADTRDLLMRRNALEEALMALAPPSGRAATAEDGQSWFANLTEMLTDAMNPENHEIEAIPWF